MASDDDPWLSNDPLDSQAAAGSFYSVWFSAVVGAVGGAILLRFTMGRRDEEEDRDPTSQLARRADGRRDKAWWRWRLQLTDAEHTLRRLGEADEPNLMAAQGGIMDEWDDGVYACCVCATPLYHSNGKFEAGCGWPCFYTCIEGAVRERLDKDGVRQELVCNACGCHLGHIFRDEHLGNPPPDERHTVNGTALKLVRDPEPESENTNEEK